MPETVVHAGEKQKRPDGARADGPRRKPGTAAMTTAQLNPTQTAADLPTPLVPRLISSRAQRLITASSRTLMRALYAKDDYTLRHSERVTALAVRLATTLRVEAEQIRLIQLSGMLHDVGKVTVSPAILNKDSSLTHMEYSLVKKHVDTGFELLRGIDHAEPVARVVRHHHERWDGSGYPDRLEEEDIPLASRVLGVADAFDAMASHRPYQTQLPRERIMRELRREKGRQFDPAVTDKLLHWYRVQTPAPRSPLF